MSQFSTDLSRLVAVTESLCEVEKSLLSQDWPSDEGFAEVSCLFGSAVRLYTAAAGVQSTDVPLYEFHINATDAVVSAAALLKDQNLTPFELSMWFMRVVSNASKSNSHLAVAEEDALPSPSAKI